MREIAWIDGGNNRIADGTEVRIHVEKGGKYTRCTFYGTSIAKVTRKDYVRIGLSKDRIYFDEARERGYKVSKGGKNVYVRMPGQKDGWDGDYKLNYDAEMKLWYVERRTK